MSNNGSPAVKKKVPLCIHNLVQRRLPLERVSVPVPNANFAEQKNALSKAEEPCVLGGGPDIKSPLGYSKCPGAGEAGRAYKRT